MELADLFPRLITIVYIISPQPSNIKRPVFFSTELIIANTAFQSGNKLHSKLPMRTDGTVTMAQYRFLNHFLIKVYMVSFSHDDMKMIRIVLSG